MQYGAWDGGYVAQHARGGQARLCGSGRRQIRARRLSLTEVHDCFSITELVTMEDLGLSDEGRAPRDILDGRYDRDGAQPCQIDGGLKCFGHPVGASGLRMAFEVYTQLLGRAGARQLGKVDLGLTHNLGGAPFNSVAAVSIFGRLN